jgi:acyl-coenzyme A synthetase/AMP-(fatty) acid ligase
MNGHSQIPHGQRLVPVVIDELSEREPEKIFAIIPRTLDLDDGFANVTYRDFANAINRMAEWLEEKMGRSSSFETLAYMGPFDIGYFVMLLAACKVGFKVSNTMECVQWISDNKYCRCFCHHRETVLRVS